MFYFVLSAGLKDSAVFCIFVETKFETMQKETYIITRPQNINGFASRKEARDFLRKNHQLKDTVVIVALVKESMSANAFLNEPEFEVKPDETTVFEESIRLHSYLLKRFAKTISVSDRQRQPKGRASFKAFDLSDQLLGEADTIEQARELFLNRYKYWVGDCDVFIEETVKI